MSTEAQIAANRLNAQSSTGPKTPEGRAAVRLNGVKHGLTAETLVLKHESQSDFTELLESLEAEHAPATPTEEALVSQLAMATWRLRRLYKQEAAFYTYKLAEPTIGKELDDAARMGVIANWSQAALSTFNRHEARLERTFYRALHELQRAKLASLRKTPVEQVPDLLVNETNYIPASPQPHVPQTTIHVVPPRG